MVSARDRATNVWVIYDFTYSHNTVSKVNNKILDTHTHARTHAHTHARTHTQIVHVDFVAHVRVMDLGFLG